MLGCADDLHRRGPTTDWQNDSGGGVSTKNVLPYFSIDHIAQVIVPYVLEQDYAVRQVLLTKLGVR